ncbi:MAG TPA: hypothetical protein VJ944_02000 [Thermoplasmataceae archaeon]|nr:hypothetical protein [Thermoplasmataceae archaeon]
MSEQLSTRDSIINIIVENPGIHFRGIQRRSGLAVGQLEYHLYQLEKDANISIREDGNVKRYFHANSGSYLERQILFYIRSNVGRDVLQKLSRSEFIPLRTLLKASKAKQERRKNIIGDMEKEGIIEIFKNLGVTQVRLKDKPKLVELARKYRESILGSLSENFISILDEDL